MDTLTLIIESVDRILLDHCGKDVLDAAESGTFAGPLWEVLRENGLTELGAPDSGTSLMDGYRVVRNTARYAMPLPLGEHILASTMLSDAGEVAQERPDGLVSLGLRSDDEAGVIVPWGRDATAIVVVAAADVGCLVRLYAAADCAIEPRTNLAGEPRDRITPGANPIASLETPLTLDTVREHLALLRTVQMAGCLDRTLDLALTYAQERVQFGRPISKFQAIQHQLAVLAGEAAAATMAADGALDRFGDESFPVVVAAAKARVGEAAGVAAEIAHQVHGAMGFTHEHQLHHFTKRLWAWRDEYGNEAFWQRRLGRAVVSAGADQVWDFVTRH